MEIKCKNCQKIYFIDDKKIPATGRVFIKCISCNKKIEIERNIDKSLQKIKSTAEYFSPDSNTALIYCQDHQAQQTIEQRLTALNFQIRHIKNQNDIRYYFRLHTFDLVILYQKGPDPDNEVLRILDYIHQMPPDIRRKCLVMYVYLGGNKYDLFDAFSRGVDICLNPLDIGEFDKLIPLYLEQKMNNYKVFFECKKKIEDSVF